LSDSAVKKANSSTAHPIGVAFPVNPTFLPPWGRRRRVAL